jgi:phosphatidate phosphatase APP1
MQNNTNKLLFSLLTQLAPILHPIESWLDRLKNKIPGRRRIVVQAYRGFGALPEKHSGYRIYLKGRVLENAGIHPARPGDGLWDNLVNSYKRFKSAEIPYAKVKVHCSGSETEVTANEEGFFTVSLDLRRSLDQHIETLQVEISLLEPHRPGHPPVQSMGEALIPPASTNKGIISDIDDTIIQTNASHRLRTIWNLISTNAYTRKPIPGASALYSGLWQGWSGKERNPTFYVSTSPWNIYDMLEQFMQLQGFPPKPVFHLRDWGITQKEIIPSEHHEHKKEFIQLVLEMYPKMPFIFIGDSSLQDPEIYTEIAHEYSERILAIYLREVTKNRKRIDRIHRLRGHLAREGVPVILAENFLPMAIHAASQGWISQVNLQQIRQEIQTGT